MNKSGDIAGGFLILRPANGITVDAEIKKPLLGRESRCRPIFEVVLDYESGTWEKLEESCRRCGLHENFLPDLYLHSVQWVSDILAEAPVAA